MAKFDFFNQKYLLSEIIEGFTDGNIKNFNGDKDFLEFIIYYGFASCLIGDDINQELKEAFENVDGFLNLALLDEYDIRGKKLYKLYEVCEKDKLKFMQTLYHIGRISVPLPNRFTKEEVLTNLALDNPVDFIDDTIKFLDGTNPREKFDYKERISPYDEESFNSIKAYSQDLRCSLINRINEEIKKEKSSLPMLPNIKTYAEEQKEIDDEINSKKVPNDYEINVNNLFFGKHSLNLGGGVINMNISLVSWFENMNIRVGNYFIFRSIPTGDYFLIDSSGKVFIPDKPIKASGISILPTCPVKSVDIAQIKTIFEESIQKLSENPIENEIELLDIKGLLEIIDNNGFIKVSELGYYEKVTRKCYEIAYGVIFKTENEPPKL